MLPEQFYRIRLTDLQSRIAEDLYHGARIEVFPTERKKIHIVWSDGKTELVHRKTLERLRKEKIVTHSGEKFGVQVYEINPSINYF